MSYGDGPQGSVRRFAMSGVLTTTRNDSERGEIYLTLLTEMCPLWPSVKPWRAK